LLVISKWCWKIAWWREWQTKNQSMEVRALKCESSEHLKLKVGFPVQAVRLRITTIHFGDEKTCIKTFSALSIGKSTIYAAAVAASSWYEPSFIDSARIHIRTAGKLHSQDCFALATRRPREKRERQKCVRIPGSVASRHITQHMEKVTIYHPWHQWVQISSNGKLLHAWYVIPVWMSKFSGEYDQNWWVDQKFRPSDS
jgi:hypothetical protein